MTTNKKLRALDPLLHETTDRLNDLLHKKSGFVERFYQLVDDVVEPPFAISIDGLWGTGKTTVMTILKDKFRDRGYPVFWFNPWKYSQSTDVVLAFLQALARQHTTALRRIEKSGGKMLRVLVNIGVGTMLNSLTHGSVSFNDVKKAFADEDLPFESYQDMVLTIEKEFRELVNAISAASQDKALIIFLDDFDRCLPQDAIKLLESLKNLFVTRRCRVIFICGIDTRVAKNFIRDHYNVTDEFAINYFRKIFNLTVSMPYSADLQALLLQHIKELYDWDDPDGKKAERLAARVVDLGRRAEMSSVRKYLNVIHNFFAFLRFHPDYTFDMEHDFILYLQIVKEAWQPLYEKILLESLNFDKPTMGTVLERLQTQTSKDDEYSQQLQTGILPLYFGKKGIFGEKQLGRVLQTFPTLM